MNQQPLKTFIVYASADKELRAALERQLKSLIDNRLVNLWSDKEILPGEHWDAAIKKQLLEAELFLMLISADFFNSSYIREQEFVAALHKLERGEAIVIPIIVRDCDWEAYPDIQKLQVLPPGGTAVTDLDFWKTPDKAWATVAREIRRRIEALRAEQAERERLRELEKQRAAAEQAARRQREQADHASFAAAQTRADFENYLKKGYTLHAAEAQAQIDVFKKEEAAAEAERLRREEIRQRKRTETERLERERIEQEQQAERQRQIEAAERAETERQQRHKEKFKADVGLLSVGGLLVAVLVWFLFFKEKDGTQQPNIGATLTQPQTTSPDLKATLAEIENGMVPVKGGTFKMGCTDEQGKGCDDDEKPAHDVTLSDFKIGKTEVTIAQYLAFCDETQTHYPEWLEPGNKYNIETGSDDYYKRRGMSRENKNHPIVGVSWDDATAYCQWLSKKISGKAFRLPTEAEWEYAAGGGDASSMTKYAGSNDIGTVAWYEGNSGGETHRVGEKKANQLGIHDMSGNVWEWCSDWYDSYSSSPEKNPTGPSTGVDRVFRGGSWYNNASGCRAAYRYRNAPTLRLNDLGFRLARSF